LDERSLRYYYPPSLPADLSQGFDTFEQLDDTADDHLDGLLRTIIDLEQRTGSKHSADVITWRGMMTKVRDLLYMFLRFLLAPLVVSLLSQQLVSRHLWK